MCGCSKKAQNAWINITYTGESLETLIGRNTKRNYGSVETNSKVRILKGDFDPNYMVVS